MKHKVLTPLAIIGGVASGLSFLGGYIVYRAGVVNSLKSKGRYYSLSENTPAENQWYVDMPKEEWQITSNDGLTLRATYIPNDHSHKVAILFHGLQHSREQMTPYAQMFYHMGFSLLMPDARAHAASDGIRIGYGWLDRKDCLGWINAVSQHLDDAQIVLMGISMGAGTVLAASGEALPDNVKAIIADSGYGSMKREGEFRLRHYYHIQPFPLMYTASLFMKLLAGYSYEDAQIDQQVQQNKLPLLIIQGKKDQTVPVTEAPILYQEAMVPKMLYLNGTAKHVQTFRTNPHKYYQVLRAFLGNPAVNLLN